MPFSTRLPPGRLCIVHLLHNSMWKDRKPLASALKSNYRALDAQTAEESLTAFEASEWGSATRDQPELAAVMG